MKKAAPFGKAVGRRGFGKSEATSLGYRRSCRGTSIPFVPLVYFVVASSSVSIRVHPWLLTRGASRELVTTDRVLNRRPGSSGRLNTRSLTREICEIRG